MGQPWEVLRVSAMGINRQPESLLDIGRFLRNGKAAIRLLHKNIAVVDVKNITWHGDQTLYKIAL